MGNLSSLRSLRYLPSALNGPAFKRSFATTKTNRLDPRSLTKDMGSELFNYTTGRFLVNDAYHLQRRRRVFDIPGLFEIIAKAMKCKTKQIVGFKKLEEGGLNRVFLVTLDTGTQLVARIPYPLVSPKTYSLASEVATMDFLRSKELPIPKVYAYSFKADNEANTEYILMEYVKGTDLSDIWHTLKEDEIASLMEQLAKLEATMMSIRFPAGGSIYYARDLKELTGKEGIPIDELDVEGAQFCIGPDVSTELWYGRREQLNVFRGPYENAESVLVAVAKKELDYLEKFGTPRAAHKHFRREYYNCEKQLPSDHASNLMHYLRLAPFLVPRDDSLNAFCIRHPDLTENNIIVTSTSSDGGGLQIVSLLDWQHAAVLPLFLNTILPNLVEIEADDEAARTMVKPTLPEGFEELTKVDQEQERELLRRRLVHYHYTVCTGSYNWVPREVMSPLYGIRLRLYAYAGAPWKGETIDLLCALMDFVRHWDSEHLARTTAQTGGDSASNINDSKSDHPSCPVTSTQDEIDSAEILYKALRRADQVEKLIRQITGCGPLPKARVPPARYEQAKALGQNFKRLTLEAAGEDVRDAIDANWPLDDFDEEKYL